MRLLVISHKPCWPSPDSPTGYATDGGFPLQMMALSQLFDSTRLLITERRSKPPEGLGALHGHRLEVTPLPEPLATGWRRKAALIPWALPNLRRIWTEVGQADAVHALVPGDIGTLGMIAARARKKPLFVRHCGTWGHTFTATDRYLARTLPKIAGEPAETVVMATGGASQPPEPGNPSISWIFSTTLQQREIEALPQPPRWDRSEPLRIVTVGRLTRGKNTRSVIAAMPAIRSIRPEAQLDVVGDGPCFDELVAQRAELGLELSVRLHGNLDHEQVMDVLAQGHLFVFPTRVAEGFPKAVIEAMAAGLPVLAPPVSVLADLIDGTNGQLLTETTAETIAESVKAITDDADRLYAAGQTARQNAQSFTLEGWRDTIGQRLAAVWGPLRSIESKEPARAKESEAVEESAP